MEIIKSNTKSLFSIWNWTNRLLIKSRIIIAVLFLGNICTAQAGHGVAGVGDLYEEMTGQSAPSVSSALYNFVSAGATLFMATVRAIKSVNSDYVEPRDLPPAVAQALDQPQHNVPPAVVAALQPQSLGRQPSENALANQLSNALCSSSR